MGEPGTLIQRFLGGPNIVFLNGADWKRHRKVRYLTQWLLTVSCSPNFVFPDRQSCFPPCFSGQIVWTPDADHVFNHWRAWRKDQCHGSLYSTYPGCHWHCRIWYNRYITITHDNEFIAKIHCPSQVLISMHWQITTMNGCEATIT